MTRSPKTVHIRIMAQPEDVEATINQLAKVLPITEMSKDYPNRVTNAGDPRVRRYLIIELEQKPEINS